MIPGTDLSRCRCGAVFKFIGYGKRLCPPCMSRWKERRSREADFPKCSCGNTLGFHAQLHGLQKCNGCTAKQDKLELQQRRTAVLDRLIARGW